MDINFKIIKLSHHFMSSEVQKYIEIALEKKKKFI